MVTFYSHDFYSTYPRPIDTARVKDRFFHMISAENKMGVLTEVEREVVRAIDRTGTPGDKLVNVPGCAQIS